MTRVRVLIVKIGAIGDVVMALPLLTALRKRYPSVHITWICGQQVKPLLKGTCLVDEILSVEENRLFFGYLFKRMWTVFSIWKRLIGRKFDLCITAHADRRYRILSFPIRCNDRRSWRRDKKLQIPIPGRYHAHEYLRLLSENIDLPVNFPKIDIRKISNKMKHPMVVLAPGGAKNHLADDALRRWPIENYASLAKKLQCYPIQVAVIGSASDQWVIPYFKGLPFVDFIGKLDLIEFISLLSQTQLLITHDSGPLHLSKLADCPAIALFGPTNPREKVGPMEKISVLWGGENLWCRPCYDGKRYAKCSNNACMSSISPDFVLSKALEILQLKEGAFRCKSL